MNRRNAAIEARQKLALQIHDENRDDGAALTSSGSSSGSWSVETSGSSSNSKTFKLLVPGERKSQRVIRAPRMLYSPEMVEPRNHRKRPPAKVSSKGAGRPPKPRRQSPVKPKTELELMRERNIQERQKFLEKIQLSKAKFEESCKPARATRDKTKVAEVAEENLEPRELRSSNRLNQNAEAPAVKRSRRYVEPEVPKAVLDVSLPVSQCTASSEEDVALFLELAKIAIEEGDKIVSEVELSSMQFQVLKTRVANLKRVKDLAEPKLLNPKFTSVALHHSVNPVLLVAGTKSGALAFWKVLQNEQMENAKSKAFVFEIHSDAVNHITFGSVADNFVYTSGQDGCVKLMDLNKEEFSLIYKPNREQDVQLNWHAHLSAQVLLASTSDGRLLRLDSRESAVAEFKCHDSAINTVDVCGSESVLTASEDGSFSLWDVRAMGGESGSLSPGRKWSVPEEGPVCSAFFSPQGGARLVTSAKNLVNVYDHGHNLAPFKTYSSCFVSGFGVKDQRQKARWHPMRQDVVLFGISQPPLSVGICHAKHMSTRTPQLPDTYLYNDRNVTDVIFHPTRMMIATCSGPKVHLHL